MRIRKIDTLTLYYFYLLDLKGFLKTLEIIINFSYCYYLYDEVKTSF